MKKAITILMALIMMFSLIVPIDGFAEMSLGGLSAGYAHSLAIMNDGKTKAWGYNTYGQLGDGTNVDKTIPVDIQGLSEVKEIINGGTFTFASMFDGTVKSWGTNSNGQLGFGDVVTRRTPTIVPGLTSVKKIVAGYNNVFALMDDGTVKSWGANGFGQLGLGDTNQRTLPTTIPNLSGVKDIAASDYFAYAVMTDGSVKSWGYNNYGQLGIGNTSNKSIPTSVPNLFDVKSLALGGYHALALMSDGSIKVTGYNEQGQLGLGDLINRTTPVTIQGLTPAKQLFAGTLNSFAILEDSRVLGWGNNQDGHLGLGDYINRNIPINIQSLNGVVQMVVARRHSLAIFKDGTVKSWGFNAQGQLGLGDDIKRNIPTLMNLTGVLMPTDKEAQKIADATISVVKAETLKLQFDVDTARTLVNALLDGTDKSSLSARLDFVQDILDYELAKQLAINNAANSVVLAETAKTQASVKEARLLVVALPDCSEKSALLIRLDVIDIGPVIVSQEYKVADTKIDLAMSLPREPYLSLALLAIEKVSDPVEKAALVAEMQIAIEKSTAAKPVTTKTANLFVRLAEITGRDNHISLAETKTSQIVSQAEKQDAIARMDIVKLIKSPVEKRAYSALIAAEQWKSTNMITAATKLINSLTDGTLKEIIRARLLLIQ